MPVLGLRIPEFCQRVILCTFFLQVLNVPCSYVGMQVRSYGERANKSTKFDNMFLLR